MIFGTVFPGMQALFSGQKSIDEVLADMDKTWDSGPKTPFG
jgi:hypothetical protein